MRPSEPPRRRQAEVVLGEDWVRPDSGGENELRARREKRGWISLNRSPLARKIIFFNLLALVVLVAGVLYLNPFRDSLVAQREAALTIEAELVAQLLAVPVRRDGDVSALPVADPATVIERLPLRDGMMLHVFNSRGELGHVVRGERPFGSVAAPRSTVITDFLNRIWNGFERLFGSSAGLEDPGRIEAVARDMLADALGGASRVLNWRTLQGETIVSVVVPIIGNGTIQGAVALSSAAGEIDALVRNEREQLLQMFLIALLVSIGLSLVLASTIANPLADLAAAAEIGRDRNARRSGAARVRIPDLAARPDEIGRLSVALRGMVAALYDRLESNEQFAADVAHEIKNPLASLRSAVGTLRVAKREDQRQTLLDVIDHDVRRLDRLVSDISNASRLDSELVKEQEESFDLLKTLRNLAEHLGREAEEKGVDFIIDLPPEPLRIQGLEGRLAQVFVNLITNAVSFCEKGDAVRVWARSRENRVLVVVEDTGPGIPDQALTKVFKRFYSERPVNQFGNHSGLGLAISKQIVEAHGGVIWAENIRRPDADPNSPPLGARFVVGLPV